MTVFRRVRGRRRPRRGRRVRERWARRVGRWASRALVLGIAVVALLVAVADTAAGRRVAERAFEWTGSVTSRGTVRIGRIEALPPGPLVLTDYEIIAPNGERVLRADRMSGHLDWTGFLEGRVRFRPCRFEGTEIHLTPGGPGGQVNLVYASEVPDGRFTVPLVWQDIELVDNVIHVRLPPKPPLVMRNVHGQADLHIAHRWTWTLRRNHGVIDLPLVEPGFREMNGGASPAITSTP